MINYLKNAYLDNSMKRGLILVVLLVLIPIASALDLESINKSVFNLGDNLEVKGNIQGTFKGGFRINLNCGNVASLLFKNVTFSENEKFDEIVKLYNGEGDCSISTQLETKDGVVDHKESNKFKIVNVLNSTFFADKDAVAKGEFLRFGGSVQKVSGSNFNGLITMEIESSSNREVFTKDVNKDWIFDFDTVNRPIGNYKVSVKYQDLYGNIGDFKDVISFRVTNKLDLNLNFNQGSYSPGDSVIASGMLKDFKGDLANGKLKVIFNDKIENIDVKNGNFSYEIKLEDNQASGNYTIGFKAEDEFGNLGEKNFVFFVKRVPKSLLLLLSKTEYSPKEKVRVESRVMDQNGVEITDGKSVELKVYGSDKNLVTEWTNAINYDLDQFALPGQYVVEGKFKDLNEKETFTVNEVELLDIKVENQSLILFNAGNVVYNKPLEITFSSEREDKFVQDIGLKPGESMLYSLNDKVKGGTYGVSVSSGGKVFNFENLFLKDERSVFRKAGNLLTGAAEAIGAGGANDKTKNVIIAVFILAIVFFGLVTRQNKLLKQIGWYIKHLVDSHVVQGEHLQKLKRAVKVKGKEKKKVVGILNKYLDSHVARELIHRDKLGLDSEKRDITVMFTDIRDFTTLVNQGDPWVIMNMVNYYFKSVTDIIYKHHGTINKYIGDSVMALFNAPRKIDNHLLCALKSGVEISKELEKLNMKLKEKGIATISVGIGVSSGEALIGSFGDKYMEFSALGGCVNMASRLQQYGSGGHVLIDEKTYEKVKDKVDVVEHGVFDIRGIGRMKVYNVIDVRGDY